MAYPATGRRARWIVVPQHTRMLREPVEGWQRKSWDRVIRSDGQHDRIAQYIAEDPTRWKGDRLALSRTALILCVCE